MEIFEKSYEQNKTINHLCWRIAMSLNEMYEVWGQDFYILFLFILTTTSKIKSAKVAKRNAKVQIHLNLPIFESFDFIYRSKSS